MLNGGGKIAFANLLLALFSLGLFSCNSTDDAADNTASVPMTVQVSNSLFAGGSRALITDEYITSGSIGVTLVDGGGVSYDNVTYSNLQYSYSAGAWTPAGGVTTPLLTATVGKAAAYYPFVADVPVTAVPVTIAEQQDVLYSGWVSDISVAKPEALFHMQHALAAVRVVLKKDASYVPSATATEVTVTSDDFYPTATLDATDGDLTPTGEAGATVTSGTGSWAVTTGGTDVDLLVIPGGVAQKITFSATIGGKKYTATTPSAVTLARALIHTYTLTLSAQGMTVGEVSVEPWGSGVTGNLTLEPYDPWKNIANGVYAVSAEGTPVTYADANESCIAVALIVNDAPTPQKLMIEKYEEAQTVARKAAYDEFGATDTEYKYFYWGGYGTDQEDIPTYFAASSVDATGYVPLIDGTYFDTGITELGAYTTWSGEYALNDWNGSSNSDVIKTVLTNGTSTSKDYAPMGIYLNKFNATPSENQGYTDWYIPSCAQLALIHVYTGRNSSYGGDVTEGINAMLTKIGGTKMDMSNTYWSSSEYSSNLGWRVYFGNGHVSNFTSKDKGHSVRLVRDIR